MEMVDLATGKTLYSVAVGRFTFCRVHRLLYATERELVAAPSSAGGESAIDIWDIGARAIVVDAIRPVGEEKAAGVVMCCRLICTDAMEVILLVGTDDGVLRAYRIDLISSSFEQILRLKIFNMTITCLAYVAALDAIIAGGPSTELVSIRHPFATTCPPHVIRQSIANEGISELVISPDEDMVITGGWDGK
jgi:hypothetical protein